MWIRNNNIFNASTVKISVKKRDLFTSFPNMSTRQAALGHFFFEGGGGYFMLFFYIIKTIPHLHQLFL